MGDLTLICRASDGLPLVETWEDRMAPTSINKETNDHTRVTQTIKMQARMICRKLPQNSTKCSIVEGDMCYHYIIEDGVCYLTVTTSTYPKKMVFLFLAELCTAFSKELCTQLGSQSVAQVLITITKPYSFMTFDRTIQKIKAGFKDPNSTKALNMINTSLNEVTNIMRRNIDEILQRGENLEDIGRMADGLKAETQRFKTSSKILASQNFLDKYLLQIITALLFLFCLYLVFRRSK
ncbi:vesicle-trafficking protein Sec22 like protein [Babesia gibsoni]|uniref:Vesicle-trafficking protein SEC22b n=1 Tax=Babesia gibsoni TaxID=33632 RepID=A0AAD8LL87_BABGI|nr:vesicle-trafficking protein Sec22 like protein [Babesia gibsoni]